MERSLSFHMSEQVPKFHVTPANHRDRKETDRPQGTHPPIRKNQVLGTSQSTKIT